MRNLEIKMTCYFLIENDLIGSATLPAECKDYSDEELEKVTDYLGEQLIANQVTEDHPLSKAEYYHTSHSSRIDEENNETHIIFYLSLEHINSHINFLTNNIKKH